MSKTTWRQWDPMSDEWQAARDEGIFIHQIYYNDETRAKLDPYFVPLDNSTNLRPDWYEFWVILNFLRDNTLDEDGFYGFLSPGFGMKTGHPGEALVDFARRHRAGSEVLLTEFSWDQTSYFINQFEQSEYWHPGTMRVSADFFRTVGLDVQNIISHTANSAYSNFIVAKPRFWRKWLELAERLWTYCEVEHPEVGQMIVRYGRTEAATYAKAFIQERITSVVLAMDRYKSAVLHQMRPRVINPLLFQAQPSLERNLDTLDVLKQYYVATRDPEFMNVFIKIRNRIRVLKPVEQHGAG